MLSQENWLENFAINSIWKKVSSTQIQVTLPLAFRNGETSFGSPITTLTVTGDNATVAAWFEWLPSVCHATSEGLNKQSLSSCVHHIVQQIHMQWEKSFVQNCSSVQQLSLIQAAHDLGMNFQKHRSLQTISGSVLVIYTVISKINIFIDCKYYKCIHTYFTKQFQSKIEMWSTGQKSQECIAWKRWDIWLHC